MNKKWLYTFLMAFALLSICPGLTDSSQAAAERGALRTEAWEEGNVVRAHRLAMRLTDSETEAAAGTHLPFLCAFAMGDYEEALGHPRRIDPPYARYADLDKLVVGAYLHLALYADAQRFASEPEIHPGFATGWHSARRGP